MSIRISFSAAALAVGLFACGGKPAVETAQPPPGRMPVDTLALRIFAPGQDTVIGPLVARWPRPERADPPAPDAEAESPGADAAGYRIQLFTSKSMAEAVAVRDEAAVDFGGDVRVDFETPYYKVRVGLFRTPQEAEPMLKRARQLGYRGAWAVKVRVAPGSR